MSPLDPDMFEDRYSRDDVQLCLNIEGSEADANLDVR